MSAEVRSAPTPSTPVRRSRVVVGGVVRCLVRADALGVVTLLIASIAIAMATVVTGGWVEDRRDEAFVAGLAETGDARRTVSIRSDTSVAVQPDAPFASITADVDEAAEGLPDVLTDALGSAETVVDTGRYAVSSIDGATPASPTFVTMRAQTGYDQRSTVVAGRRAAVPASDGDRRIEVEVSVETSALLGVDVDDVIEVSVSLDDPLGRLYRSLPDPFSMEVVGIVELTPADEPPWFGDARLHEPIVVDTAIGADRLAMVAIAPDALASGPFVVDGRSPFAVDRRARLEPGLTDPADESELRAAVRALDASTERTALDGGVAIVTTIGAVLDDIETQRDQLGQLGQLARLALLAVGASALAVIVAAWAARSTAVMNQLAARGAGRVGVVCAGTGLCAAVSGVGAIVGVMAASLAMASRGGGTPAGVMVAIVGVSAVASAVALARVHSGPRRTDADGVVLVGPIATPHGWPRARGAFGAMLVAGSAGVVVSVLARGRVVVDLATAMAIWMPPAVAVVIVFRTRASAVRRRLATSVAVGVVAAGAVWVVGDAFEPTDTGSRLAAVVAGFSILAAAGLGSVAVAAPTDVAVGARPIEADRTRLDAVWSVLVGATLGAAWLAILIGVVLEQLALLDGVEVSASWSAWTLAGLVTASSAAGVRVGRRRSRGEEAA